MLTLEEAKTLRRCRLCEQPIDIGGTPEGWMNNFGRMTYPIRVTLDFGKEFAHTDCLEKEEKANG